MISGRQLFANSSVTNPPLGDNFLAGLSFGRTPGRHNKLKPVYGTSPKPDWQIACSSQNCVCSLQEYKSLVHQNRNEAIRGEVKV